MTPRLVGVVHLLPLPGSPRAEARCEAVAASAARDAVAMRDAGFDHVVVENFGDAPFFAENVPPVTVSAMTACALAVRSACPEVVLGINVLRNDAPAALAVAAVAGASFIRVNVHTGARVTDQGIVQGRAAETLRARRALGADAVAVWADVDVKHSAPLGERDPAREAEDTVKRGLAEVVLVTGEGTGRGVDEAKLRRVREAVPGHPVLVASGATLESLRGLAGQCDGVIVGSALRAGGVAGGPVDLARAEAFARAFFAAFGVRR
ncbi:MAG TPA: BtpA/SgcQ family protein [Polyangiaceae bacterium]